jgi:hypothetical protein
MMASDAMRGAVERHFGVRLAFQNYHGGGAGAGGRAGIHSVRLTRPRDVSSGRRLAGTHER